MTGGSLLAKLHPLDVSYRCMAVYVDEIISTPKTKWWPYVKSCRMIADTRLELFAMAQRLNLNLDWFRPANRKAKRIDYFRLTKNTREAAIREGALSLNSKVFKSKCVILFK